METKYRLYDITNVEIEQSNSGQIIKDVNMQYYVTIPANKLTNEQYIDNIVSKIIGDNKSYYKPGIGEKHNFVIVKTDNDFNYLGCVYVFFPNTHFLDCADSNHRNICDYYFEKTKK